MKEVSGSPRTYEWTRYSESPFVRYRFLIVLAPVTIVAVMMATMLWRTEDQWMIGLVLVALIIPGAMAYIIMEWAYRRIPDNLLRLYDLPFEEAATRFEEAIARSGIKYSKLSTEEYIERGTIAYVREQVKGSPSAMWIYELDNARAAVISEAPHHEGHTIIVLIPYEEQGRYLLDKVKEAADRTLGP